MLRPAMLRSSHVEVHLFRRRGRRVEWLVLRRAKGRRRLPGVWQPVTGGRRRFESSFGCARREVREETGLEPRRWWALETPTLLYDAGRDVVEVLPLFVAEVRPRDAVRLSSEHDAHAFVSAREAGRRYLWDAQRQALAAARRQILERADLAAALEITVTAGRKRR